MFISYGIAEGNFSCFVSEELNGISLLCPCCGYGYVGCADLAVIIAADYPCADVISGICGKPVVAAGAV